MNPTPKDHSQDFLRVQDLTIYFKISYLQRSTFASNYDKV